jgi:hypothetical protein
MGELIHEELSREIIGAAMDEGAANWHGCWPQVTLVLSCRAESRHL